jgi:hypothetical protein
MPAPDAPGDAGQASAELNPVVNAHLKELKMKRLFWLISVAAGITAGIAYAQYPILDMVAGRVIQKYQTSSCEQLWQKKSEPKSMEEQRVIGLLQNDPQMRTAFINQVAAPIANKMFECGMIP